MAQMTEQQHKVVMRVHERITAFPDAHDQSYWYWSENDTGTEEIAELMTQPGVTCVVDEMPSVVIDVAEMDRCGTTACLAGHAVCAAIELGIEMPDDARYVWEAAGPLLGVMQSDGTTLGGMFGTDDATARAWVAEAAETGNWDHVS